MESVEPKEYRAVYYKFSECYRYACPGCDKRWGDPDPNRWVDVVRCEKCHQKRNDELNGLTSKKRAH
jgi:hypothetical protein